MALERPVVSKPEGDIPFDLGIEDIVVGDGAEAVAGLAVAQLRAQQLPLAQWLK